MIVSSHKALPLLIFFGLLCFFAPFAQAAQPKTAQAWSEAVQKRYAGFKAVHAQFEQLITHGESGVVEKRQGEVYFSKPLLVRWTTFPPAEEVLVVTSENIWQYLPDEELAYKYHLDAVDNKNAFLRVLFGLSSLDKTFDVQVLPREDGLARLHLEPYEPSPSLLQADMWLDDKATVKRLVILDFYGNKSDLTLNKIDFNPTVPKDTFSFTPPPGVEVEDQSEFGN